MLGQLSYLNIEAIKNYKQVFDRVRNIMGPLNINVQKRIILCIFYAFRKWDNYIPGLKSKWKIQIKKESRETYNSSQMQLGQIPGKKVGIYV